MTTLAIVHPSQLVARELRERLESEPQLCQELRLLTTAEEEVGTLTEARGAAAVVQRYLPGALEGVAVAFLCGPLAELRRPLAELPAETRAILLAPDATVVDGPPLVAGVNLDQLPAAGVLLSPHPAVVHLAHLLRPLQDLGLRRATATLLQPVSLYGASALDELLEQARSLLTFQPITASTSFAHQMAFNLVPAELPGEALGEQLEAILGTEALLAVQVIQAGIFHGTSASLYVELAPETGPEAVGRALEEHPGIELRDPGEGPLGPIDAALSEAVLIAPPRRLREPAGAYWLWSTMDNLTCGGAHNAMAIARALLQ
jgi:aspartate-semialdehyde dehydrogenase